MMCSICLKDGHTASSCKQRPKDGSNSARFAASMVAARERLDRKTVGDSAVEAWERLCRDMRKGAGP